jgi:hypothetical protein
MSIEDKIKDHIGVWFLGTLLTGFLAGLGAYQFLVTNSGRKILPDDLPDKLQTANAEARNCLNELTTCQNRPSIEPSSEPSSIEFVRNGTFATAPLIIDPEPQVREVAIFANADVRADVGGQMELEVAGAIPECKSGTLYRTDGAAEVLSAELRCTDKIPANTGRTYSAQTINKGASARGVLLRAIVRTKQAPLRTSAANPGKWVLSGGHDCLSTCRSAGLKPLGSGKSLDDRDYYVCSASIPGGGKGENDLRPGFNWPNDGQCLVFSGGRMDGEKATRFKCYCR